MGLASDGAGWLGGTVAALGSLVALLGWRRRQLVTSLLGALLLASAAWLALGGAAPEIGPALLAGLGALAGMLWLVDREGLRLRAATARQAELTLRLQRCEQELEHTQRQMQQAQAAAEAADQAKARFLAAASHDLRQPAHALGLYMAALRAAPLSPEQAEIAERMQSSLAALEMLFAALLDVSRMDAGAVLPQWDTVALAPLLRRLADEWAPQAEARGLRLALHCADAGAMTVTDPLLLERVLRNLLANALKYTSAGGLLLACRLRSAADGQRAWRIEVWDSGAGIARAEQERVFEEFYQVGQAAADPGRGLGLGLAIVQRLARLLQLRVLLHSVAGRGSVFFVEGLAQAGAAPQAAAAARLELRRLAGLLVVVLDDDAAARDAMCRLLQLWDCRAVAGAHAAAVLQQLPVVPQAVVADLQLGAQHSGVQEVARLSAAWGCSVPVLWISGQTAPSGLRATLPAAATVFTKPVSPARLRAWLEQQLPERSGSGEDS